MHTHTSALVHTEAHLAGAVEGIVELYNKSQRLTQVNVFSYLKPGDNFPFKMYVLSIQL